MKALRLKFNLKYLLIAAAAIALLGNGGFRQLVKNYLEYSRLAKEKTRLEAQHRELEEQRKDISSRPAIEQAARRELSMLRPEETEYRFPPPKDSDK
jgi:cell division protein FtsB